MRLGPELVQTCNSGQIGQFCGSGERSQEIRIGCAKRAQRSLSGKVLCQKRVCAGNEPFLAHESFDGRVIGAKRVDEGFVDRVSMNAESNPQCLRVSISSQFAIKVESL